MNAQLQMNDKIALKLPAALDCSAASALLDHLRDRQKPGGRVRIDASGVESVTLPCVQVIHAAARSEGGILIERPSAAFAEAFDGLAIDWSLYCGADSSADEIAEPSSDSDQPSESPMAKRILTIDDSKTMRDMLMLTLADAGFDVLQAVDGQDGLDVLSKERVDVVITDINMPKMDGYEVIRQLRGKPEHQNTPILVLTTESEAKKKNLAREVGATGWLVKPFEPERLVETILKVSP